MQAREYLEQVEKIDRLIENKSIELMQWKAKATSTSAPIGGERVQSSGSQQKMEDAVIRINEIEYQIIELIDGYINTKQEIVATIEMLDATSYDILHKKYIQGMNLYDVSRASNMACASVKRVHNRGLNKVQEILDDREKKK